MINMTFRNFTIGPILNPHFLPLFIHTNVLKPLRNKEGFKTFMVARELDSEETRWPTETTE